MKIIILAGGYSLERDVSFKSSVQIGNALIENNHDVMILDLYLGKENDIFSNKYLNNKSKLRYNYNINEDIPDLSILPKHDSLISSDIINQCKKADIVFIGLHGSIGENGKLQSYLDLHNIKYTGSGYEGCLLAMNKEISKQIMIANKVLTPNWICIKANEDYNIENIKYPCIIKPCNNGSSVGVKIVNNKNELTKEIEEIKIYDDNLLIEELIKGREFSVGILNNNPLPVIEIIPKQGFYDYKNKYQKDLTTEICPAKISDTLEQNLKETAITIHKILKLDYYSRMDFIVDNENKIYCLEANALPGMTPTSLLPQEAKAAGINYNNLCEYIIKKDKSINDSSKLTAN